MKTPRVLIVEDQRALSMALAAAVRQAGASSEIAPTATIARKFLDSSKSGFDALILDIGLPDQNGLDFYASLPAEKRPPAVVVTAHGEIDNTITARKLGIAEFLTKPLDFAVFTETLQRILPEPARESTPDPESPGTSPFIGASKAMRPVFQQIAHACASTEPVLISGETGTGKSLAASVIRNHSAPKSGGFAMFQSGAGTRTEALRKALDEARAGTLLIEEIETLDSESQAELLRHWEAGAEDESFPRVLATAGADLRKAVEEGTVRSDLYYRLQVLEIRLPPLKDRMEDLPALFEFFLAEIAPERKILIEPAVLRRLQSYAWPGNLRELHNVASYAATVSGTATRMTAADLPDHLVANSESPGDENAAELDAALGAWIDSRLEDAPVYRELAADLERRLIRHLLDRHDGKLARLASEMKANRTTLRKKLRGS